jgi:starch synthase
MRILFVTPELAPWSKAGGLGDATVALGKALAALGHEVRAVTPLYGSVPGREKMGTATSVRPAAASAHSRSPRTSKRGSSNTKISTEPAKSIQRVTMPANVPLSTDVPDWMHA